MLELFGVIFIGILIMLAGFFIVLLVVTVNDHVDKIAAHDKRLRHLETLEDKRPEADRREA